MNILPKKRWHVRTKDNIARVRKDEALAAEEEKKKQLRIQIATKEARIEALREKARQQYGKQNSESSKTSESQPLPSQHVNFFYEESEMFNNKPNEDHEREKKLEKEKYEKQIGYLTYLGQDTNEITGQVSWYNKPREEKLKEQEEVSKKQKVFEDPLEDMRKYLDRGGRVKKANESVKSEKNEPGTKHGGKRRQKEKKSKHKKKKKKRKYSSESEGEEVVKRKMADLEELRRERIKREKEERKRAEEVLLRLNGMPEVKKEDNEPERSRRYNTQFNPHLAKQNFVNK